MYEIMVKPTGIFPEPLLSEVTCLLLYRSLPLSEVIHTLRTVFTTAWTASEWLGSLKLSDRWTLSSHAQVGFLISNRRLTAFHRPCNLLLLNRKQKRGGEGTSGQNEERLHSVQHGTLQHWDRLGIGVRRCAIGVCSCFLTAIVLSCVVRGVCTRPSWGGCEWSLRWTMWYGLTGRGLSYWLRWSDFWSVLAVLCFQYCIILHFTHIAYNTVWILDR